ncbi:MAG TPA: YihY/virulence factor BrkB family protein [Sphingomicrobium sp.]|jgi:membrane protein
MDMQTSTTAAADKGRHADSPWQMPFSAWKDVAVRTWKESSNDNVGLVAAGVAFYGFLAIVPLLGAIVLTYGLIASPQSVAEHLQALTKSLPADAAELVGDQLMNVVQTSGGKKGLGLVAALAVALWGARNAMGSIITALNIAYEEEEKRGFIKVTLISLAMTVAAVLVALLAVAATTVLGALEDLLPNLGPFGIILSKIVSFALLLAAAAAAVATLYRYGPSREKAKWTWITAGSAFAAIAWLGLTLGFGFYVTNFGNYNATYGSLGAVVVLLTWLYLSSYVLLFGAELNSELEHQTAKDTTEGSQKPLGERGAWSADHVATEGATSKQEGVSDQAGEQRPAEQPVFFNSPQAAPEVQQPNEHTYLTARATARVGQIAGFKKVGMVTSILSTTGLALMRRKGREAAGATMLAAAAGIALMKRSD